ncbi:MAG: HSP90 family protein [Prevotellaceae bacterium]|jgi:molecular chaperone HtpG|nr:HSP90 family protein [Prevotellaceae bacterium]
MENNSYLFQVNLKGMIELLSEHIYSSPNVFVRELLQNGVDAITARKSIDESFTGEVNVYIDDGRSGMIFEDNGIGLSEDEVHKFLSVIGQSSKRDDILEKDYIGKFGIGLLSCFVVSDEIIVETRSLYKKYKGVRWVGKADGTYTIEQIENEWSPGTRIILRPKKNCMMFFEKEEIKKNILYFGSALPVKINLIINGEKKLLVDGLPVWLDPNSTKEDLLQYGKQAFNINFLDVFRMSSTAGEIDGVGFILPYRIQFTGTKDHKIYLKRMFLCEQVGNLFPEWTSFVKCVINTNTLKPTASRESLMDNEDSKAARKELNSAFKEYLRLLSVTNLNVLEEIIATHHLYIKALAAEDAELLKLFVDYIPFETNKGMMSFKSLKAYNNEIFYTPSMDDFKQIRRIAGSQGKTVINAAYSFETDLIRKISIVFRDVTIAKITPQDILSNLGEAVVDDQQFLIFEKKANKVLKSNYCKAQIKKFEPKDTPAIYVANDEALNNKNLSHLANTSNPFASTLSGFIKNKEELTPTLCFNKDNDLINDLTYLDDDTMFEAAINILYVQSLMLGNYPINKKEMMVFNDSIYKLLIMGMNNFSQKINLEEN